MTSGTLSCGVFASLVRDGIPLTWRGLQNRCSSYELLFLRRSRGLLDWLHSKQKYKNPAWRFCRCFPAVLCCASLLVCSSDIIHGWFHLLLASWVQMVPWVNGGSLGVSTWLSVCLDSSRSSRRDLRPQSIHYVTTSVLLHSAVLTVGKGEQ